jgi:hypothetical protein
VPLGPITRVLSIPRRVTLGEREFLVSEFRLCDLAELQGWLDSLEPDPMEGLSERLAAAPTVPARNRLLRDALEAAERGPAVMLDDSSDAALSTPEGGLRVLAVALSRHHPEVGPKELIAIMGDLRPGQYAKLHRVVMGVDPERAVSRMLGAEPGGEGGKSISWGELIDDLARSHHWSYETIASMTLSQVINARSHGKKVEMVVNPRHGETRQEAMARIRKMYQDAPADTPTAPDTAPSAA